jgi:hypothetical protein
MTKQDRLDSAKTRLGEEKRKAEQTMFLSERLARNWRKLQNLTTTENKLLAQKITKEESDLDPYSVTFMRSIDSRLRLDQEDPVVRKLGQFYHINCDTTYEMECRSATGSEIVNHYEGKIIDRSMTQEEYITIRDSPIQAIAGIYLMPEEAQVVA